MSDVLSNIREKDMDTAMACYSLRDIDSEVSLLLNRKK